MSVVEQPTCLPRPLTKVSLPPAIAHITHPKAGSQWIRRILAECVPNLVVPRTEDLIRNPGLSPGEMFLSEPPARGQVYPALYLPKFLFDTVEGSETCRRFVVIRDLRDTLISGYFSFLHSHGTDWDFIRTWRSTLEEMSVENGLIYLFHGFTEHCSAVQESWIDSGDPVIRYEDLLSNDVEILQKVLLEHCGLPVMPEVLRSKIVESRFENLTGGRKLGEEDRFAHLRKGTPGDWRNHFTPKVTEMFKDRFGEVLIRTGYEKNNDW